MERHNVASDSFFTPVVCVVACVFQTDAMTEVNTDFFEVLNNDLGTIGGMILEQATGTLALPNLLTWTSTDTLQRMFLVPVSLNNSSNW